MPNVSRPSRPDQAGKSQSADKSLDTQEQLRQLRENLLHEAREGTGTSGDAAAALSKKELAARRFAGASGGGAGAGSAQPKGGERENVSGTQGASPAPKQAPVASAARQPQSAQTGQKPPAVAQTKSAPSAKADPAPVRKPRPEPTRPAPTQAKRDDARREQADRPQRKAPAKPAEARKPELQREMRRETPRAERRIERSETEGRGHQPVRPEAQRAEHRTEQRASEPRAPREERPPPAPRVLTPNPVPPITFPEALPVSGRRDEIARAIEANQVVIVSGETGSGKTTQLPKICLALGRGVGAGGSGLIDHTQPRCIAASATGRRIAEGLGTPFSEVVGYKVRFTDNLAPGASVKLMTDGILLAETQTDPLLEVYDTIIIDEAHERSLNIDFLLGYLKEILPKRPDLKLIVTSATIDAERFARHFGSKEKPAPVIEVSERLYPVEVRYRPVEEDSVAVKSAQGTLARRSDRNDRKADRDLMEAIVDAVDELCRVGPGDVLVFLPGEREIRDAAEALRKHHPPHTEILPLFARLSAQEQERVFRPSNARRIVLATNVAETSLTVPGIRYVVDTGMARVKRYSYRNKVEQLQIEPVSQAAANQRAGRCGRVADGVCIRLYDEADFQARPRFTDPEILRSSLASVILRMKSLHLTAIETFPFIEPPPGRAIADGYQLLNELGAVDDDNALTPLGRELARLPLDPRVGRMILAARDHHALKEVLVIASALSVQDPRDRPIEAQEQADQAHRQFVDERSEFLQWTRI
ncbi:macromolecule metabolism macromolecule synthesis, modification dna-replication, repair [Candidatus Paraburkholderia schumanniana]|nr:macromolecule metabolism macromolecule synthesis, modification dna-replication, repair [Candidatus Paraburkholderia schumannianae]